MKAKKEKSELQLMVEKMFFSYFNPSNGVNFVHIIEDDTLYATLDGTPETTLLSYSEDDNGTHIVLHHGSWEKNDWEWYLIMRNKIAKNFSRENEVTIEELSDKLMDTYNEYFKK